MVLNWILKDVKKMEKWRNIADAEFILEEGK
jgi:hypothetical protein